MKFIAALLTLLWSLSTHADQQTLTQKIWAHQAIMATFQIDHQHYLTDQKEMARYFSASAWKSYLSALRNVQHQQLIEGNHYQVDAVALGPVALKSLAQSGFWQASMPILVQYKNFQYKQQQSLKVTIEFKATTSGQGVNGYQLLSYQSHVLNKPCRCVIKRGAAHLKSKARRQSSKQPPGNLQGHKAE